MERLYDRVSGPALVLRRPPALEGVDTPYLEGIEQALGWRRRGEHLALSLHVGLPPTVPATARGHDLVDYLRPLVDRLGEVRFDAVFAAKQQAHRSHLRIGPATASREARAPQVKASTKAPATSIDWKQELHDACRAATGAPAAEGPVELDLRFTVSRRRTWTALWKPALQALGPVLGVDDPGAPYIADHGRVTSLGLHRRWDDAAGQGVLVEVWWREQVGSGHQVAGRREEQQLARVHGEPHRRAGREPDRR